MKIFCIGFHKTGTTSLASALETLSYRVTGPCGNRDPEISQKVYTLIQPQLRTYDAFQDNPWPLIYRYLDQNHPQSKFILTVRDSQSWIRSQVEHFGRRTTPMREWIYGVGHPKGNEETYINRIEKHNRDVIEYFKGRPNDLLIVNLAQGDGWNKLCPFLGKEIPDLPFPHKNKRSERKRKKSKRAILLERIKTIFRKRDSARLP